MTTTVPILDIDSQASLDALLARKPGEVRIRVTIAAGVDLRLPRLVKVVSGWLRAAVRGAWADATADGARAYATADGARAYATADGAWAYATADGARAYATADGAWAYATADGARAYATAAGARAYATADGARAYATAMDARAIQYDTPDLTLEHVRKAAKWATEHEDAPGEIAGVERRYDQSTWDCGTRCCVWGAAHLLAYGVPVYRGPSPEWASQSKHHQEVAELLSSPSSTPEQIEAAARKAIA